MTIIPEYTAGYLPPVEHVLNRLIDRAERSLCFDEAEVQFTIGLWEEQRVRSIEWMRQAVDSSGRAEKEIARLLDIDRSSVNRWLNGQADPSFAKAQRLYACVGGRDEADHPFRPREQLNFSGYKYAVIHMRSWIQAKRLARQREFGRIDFDIETFLCVYRFYATTDPQHLEAMRNGQLSLDGVAQDVVDWVGQIVGRERQTISSVSKLRTVVVDWGMAWLVCLTWLAEEENGIGKYKVTSKRPVSLT